MTKCSDIMTANPACCTTGDHVQHAAQLMRDENVGAIPVVEDLESRKLIGIVTDRDITIKVTAEGKSSDTTLDSIMSRDLVFCHPDDNINRALDEMMRFQVRRIPVVDENMYIVGIIAQADVATRMANDDETGEVVEQISKPE
jgi:CBS domain-containing protein